MKKIAFVALLATAVSAPALAQYAGPFKKMDTNSDNMVTVEEWGAAGRNVGNFKVGDTNKDGKMDMAEFTALNEKWKAAKAAGGN